MKKINLIKILNKEYPKLKKKKISPKDDLMRDMIFDSLEAVKFLHYLENKFDFKIKNYISKNKNFQIHNLEKFINK
tara:strand:+ start:1064 stop:1291 length:228 start_codon:yes stop_codon:yes gene_type:complete